MVQRKVIVRGATNQALDELDAADIPELPATGISFDDTGLTITAVDVQEMGEALDAAISAGGIPATIFDAAGDIIVASAADTAARLAAGSEDDVLTIVSGIPAWAAPTGGGAVGPYTLNRYTAGDIALTSTSMAAVSGPSDLVIAAAAGDLLDIVLSVRTATATGGSVSWDMATMVSAAPVNFLSSLNGTPLLTGVPGWFIEASSAQAAGAPLFYEVQAGDIESGNVTLRFYARVSSNRTVAASATIPLIRQVKNQLQ